MSLKGRDIGLVNSPYIYRCQFVHCHSKFKSIANMFVFAAFHLTSVTEGEVGPVKLV